jgi:hypothetical protein
MVCKWAKFVSTKSFMFHKSLSMNIDLVAIDGISSEINVKAYF